MKTNEFQIGDWATICGLPVVVKATKVYEDVVLYKTDKTDNWHVISEYGVKLTEKLLNDNGFETENDVITIIDNNNWHVFFEPKTSHLTAQMPSASGLCSLDLLTVYVHQFQQLLRMLGFFNIADGFEVKTEI